MAQLQSDLADSFELVLKGSFLSLHDIVEVLPEAPSVVID
jgi:hypothetical protein